MTEIPPPIDVGQNADLTGNAPLQGLTGRRPGTDAGAILDALPVAVYAVDADGRLTYWNKAATDLWGQTPERGKTMWCGSHAIYWPDGTPVPIEQCMMAVAVRERRAISGFEAVIERRDGSRVTVSPAIVPLYDGAGHFVGAANAQRETFVTSPSHIAAQRLAAIVSSSDDAIVAKDLNGIITDWNGAAERLFGYTATEAIGQPVTMLIPPDRIDEEPEILSRIRQGDRIDHYETIRRRKDGTLIDISITVSPIHNFQGRVVGASKIARDFTERRKMQEQQDLLLREMNHRIKNSSRWPAAW